MAEEANYPPWPNEERWLTEEMPKSHAWPESVAKDDDGGSYETVQNAPK